MIKTNENIYRRHPWHGVSTGADAPKIVNVYVEIIPTDVFKYEVDKESGILKIDRPQKYSNQCPTLYGFIPQTYCADLVGKFCSDALKRDGIEGDHDPLDICVLTERPIQHGDILCRAVPIGGMRMIDKNEADDKIIAVLHEDDVYGKWRDISECPKNLINRLKHYFLTYKELPSDDQPRKVEITDVYGVDVAQKVIELAQADYKQNYLTTTPS
jgi:inorganic pyrophosphatase